jgi:hypothetical protein
MVARNCLVFGLPANLVDVVSFSYHVNHEIIGRVEVKVNDNVLSSPHMESQRGLRRTRFLKHSRSKIDNCLSGERRLWGLAQLEKCLASITNFW